LAAAVPGRHERTAIVVPGIVVPAIAALQPR
jgi:hypothetical protein